MSNTSEDKPKAIDWYDFWNDVYGVEYYRKNKKFIKDRHIDKDFHEPLPQAERVVSLILDGSLIPYADSESLRYILSYNNKNGKLTIDGFDIEDDINYILSGLKRVILEYKLFIKKFPNANHESVYNEYNEDVIYEFLECPELEEIINECGICTVKQKRFSPSTNRQRAIGLLLYEFRTLYQERYATDSEAIRAVREYALGGVNILEKFGMGDVDDSVLRRYLRCTKKCINESKVLPLTDSSGNF